MALFTRARKKRAEKIALQIGENLLHSCVFPDSQRAPNQAEIVREIATRVCSRNPTWRLLPDAIVRETRSGDIVTPFAEVSSALDLLGVIIDGDLRANFRLSEADHREVMLRVLRTLSTRIEQRSLSELTSSLESEIANGDSWDDLTGLEDDPLAVHSAQADLALLAEQLVAASYGAVVFAEFLSESAIRPLTALRLFTARTRNWRLQHGRLSYRGNFVGAFTNEDALCVVFSEMMRALLDTDYPHLTERAEQALSLTAMRIWDHALARLFLQGGRAAAAG